MKGKNRLFAILLAFAMIISYMPTLAFANDTVEEKPSESTENQITDNEVKTEGDTLIEPEQEVVQEDSLVEEDQISTDETDDVQEIPLKAAKSSNVSLQIWDVYHPGESDEDSRQLYGYVGEKALINFPAAGDILKVEIEKEAESGGIETENVNYVAVKKDGQIHFTSQKEGATDYFVADKLSESIGYRGEANSPYEFTYYTDSMSEGEPGYTFNIGYRGIDVRPDADDISIYPGTTYIEGEATTKELYGYIGSKRIKNFPEGDARLEVNKDGVNYIYPSMPIYDENYEVDKYVLGDLNLNDGYYDIIGLSTNITQGVHEYSVSFTYTDAAGNEYDKDSKGNNYTKTISVKGVKAPPEKIVSITLADKEIGYDENGNEIEVDRGALNGYIGEDQLLNFPVEGDAISAGDDTYSWQYDEEFEEYIFKSEDGDAFSVDGLESPLDEGNNTCVMIFSYYDVNGNWNGEEYEYTFENVEGVTGAESIEYIPAKLTDGKTVLYEGIDSSRHYFPGMENNYYTYYDIEDLFPRKGDKLNINYGDYTETYTCKLVTDEDGDEYYALVNDDNNELWPMFSSNQTKDNTWKPGNNYSFTVSCMGVSHSLDVTIKACPIKEIKVDLAESSINASKLLRMNYFSLFNRGVDQFFIEGDKITFTYDAESGFGDSITHKESYTAKPNGSDESGYVEFTNDSGEVIPFYPSPEVRNDLYADFIHYNLLKGENRLGLRNEINDYLEKPCYFNLTIVDDLDGDWTPAQYSWSDDYKECIAYSYKENYAGFTKAEKATASISGTPATCEESGSGTYIATFTDPDFATQEIEAGEIGALGHDWGEWIETKAATCINGGEETRTCKRDTTHTETRATAVDPDAHDWGEWVETREATCTIAGEETRTCNHDAAHTETRATAVDPDAHDWGEPTYEWAEDNSSVTATRVCIRNEEHVDTQTVNTIHTTPSGGCDVDKEVVYIAIFDAPFSTQTKSVTIPAGQHTWDNGVQTKAPTCDQEGTKLFTCTVCNETKEEPIPALNHDWNEPAYVWTADNSSVTAARICKRDVSHIETETVNTTAEDTKPATCTEKGERTYTTAEFENEAFEVQTKKVDTPALDHEWGEPTYVWASDNSSVTATRVCIRNEEHVDTQIVDTTHTTPSGSCDVDKEVVYTATFNAPFSTQTKSVTIPAGEHVWDNGTQTKAPTCDQEGTKLFRCTVCNGTKEEPIPALGHSKTHHEALAADCTKEGNSEYWSCSRCNKYFSDEDCTHEIAANSWVISKTDHNYGTIIAEQSATCTEGGVEAHYICSVCNKLFDSDKNETTEAALAISALGHDLGQWAPYDENNHIRECSRCEYSETAAHNWDEGVISEPENDKDIREKTYTCTDCEETKTEPVQSRFDEAKAGALAELGRVNPNDYSGAEKTRVENAIAEAEEAIENAETVLDINAAKNNALNTIRAQKTNAQKNADAIAAARNGYYDGSIPGMKNKKPKAAKKAITVKWSKFNKKKLKRSGATNYEIWVCSDGAFANGSTIERVVGKKKSSLKIKGLTKGVTYYTKVRAIKYVGGTKVVGPWSAVKAVKVKK